MAADLEGQAAAAAVNGRPPVIEGPGRYCVYLSPDGGWVVARAVGICDTCQGCGCGEQAEPIVIPSLVISMAMQQGKGKLLGMLKAVTGRG
jgi:hypothetical protein